MESGWIISINGEKHVVKAINDLWIHHLSAPLSIEPLEFKTKRTNQPSDCYRRLIAFLINYSVFGNDFYIVYYFVHCIKGQKMLSI